MLDTQRFAIWHPPGMPEHPTTKKNPPSQQPTPHLPKNVQQILVDYKWGGSVGSSPPTPGPSATPIHKVISNHPVSSSRPVTPSHKAPQPSASSSYRASAGPPQPSRLPNIIAIPDDNENSDGYDYEEDSSEDEAILVERPRTATPAFQMANKAPIKTLDENRTKGQERLHFAKEPAKGSENKPVPPSTSVKTVTFAEHPRVIQMKNTNVLQKVVPADAQAPKNERTEPMIPPASKVIPEEFVWRTRSNSTTSVSQKALPMKTEHTRIERPSPVTQSLAKNTPLKGDLPLHETPESDFNFLARNSLATLNPLLVHLQETAFTSYKMSMMEASIRKFHLIAADADIQLIRELISMKPQDKGEMRSQLIERHRIFVETQALDVQDEMQECHSHWDNRLNPVDERRWEDSSTPLSARNVPPAPVIKMGQEKPSEKLQEKVYKKVTIETIEEKPSEIWKPGWLDDDEEPSPSFERDIPPSLVHQKGPENPSEKPQEKVSRKVTVETVEEQPSGIWKPTRVDDTESSTSKMDLDEIFERVQADLKRDEKAHQAPAALSPAPNKGKSTTAWVRTSIQNPTTGAQVKAQGSSAMTSNAAASSVEHLGANPPEKPVETPLDKPTDTPNEKQTTKNTIEKGPTKQDTIATKPVTKAKTAKERRKAKGKAIDTGQMNDPVEAGMW